MQLAVAFLTVFQKLRCTRLLELRKEENVEIGYFALRYRAVSAVALPKQKTNLLRSAFGAQVAKVLCGMAEHHAHKPFCAYERLFEGRGAKRRPGCDCVPPFVFECADRRTTLRPGDCLDVVCILCAPGTLFRDAARVWAAMGQGLGGGEQQFVLESVTAINPFTRERQRVTEESGDVLVIRDEDIRSRAQTLSGACVEVEFLTPCRIETEGRVIQHPRFEDIIAAAVRRATTLVHAWGDGSETIHELRGDMSAISTALSDVRFEEWSRTSSRQKRAIRMGGFVGSMTFRGDLHPFLALLVFAELVHVGAGLGMGNGKIRIRAS